MDVVGGSGAFFQGKDELKSSSPTFDVTVVNPLGPTALAQSEQRAVYALEDASKAKKTKYGGTYRPTYKLLPLAFSTCGDYSASVHDLVKDLGRLKAEFDEDNPMPGEAGKLAIQRLAREREVREREEARRRKESKRLEEEIDLYKRGFSARKRSAERESEKAEAEQYWRRLVALRQRRRKGTAAAAAAVNNLGVLLVEQGGTDGPKSDEGRKLLKAAVDMARVGLRSTTVACPSPGAGGKALLRGVATPSEVGPYAPEKSPDDETMKLPSEGMESPFDVGPRRKAGTGKHNSAHEKHTPSRPPGATTTTKHRPSMTPAMVTSPSGASSPRTSGWESMMARATSAADGGREEGFADDKGGKGHTATDHWAAPLALFSSNLFFATEGPGRPSGGSDDDESLDSARLEDLRDGGEKGSEGRRALRNREYDALFEALSAGARTIAAGATGSWVCSGVGIVLFEDEGPFWWGHEGPRKEAKKRNNEADCRQAHDGPLQRRRNAVMKKRQGGVADQDREGRFRLTDLEVIEVLDPPRAARIRIRMARQEAQRARQEALSNRRKERAGAAATARAKWASLHSAKGPTGWGLRRGLVTDPPPGRAESSSPSSLMMMAAEGKGPLVRAVRLARALRAKATRVLGGSSGDTTDTKRPIRFPRERKHSFLFVGDSRWARQGGKHRAGPIRITVASRVEDRNAVVIDAVRDPQREDGIVVGGETGENGKTLRGTSSCRRIMKSSSRDEAPIFKPGGGR